MAVFKLASLPRDLDLAQSMAWVARHHGKSQWRQLAEITRLMAGPARLTAQDYYKLALFRAEIGLAGARAYQGDRASTRMNLALSPPPTGQWALLANKLLTGHVLAGAGLPVPVNLAYHAAAGGVPGLPALPDAAAVADWLRHADLPVFGKPVDGSLAIGAASFLARTGDLIRLGDGRDLPADLLADEITRHFPRGYLFQALTRQHPGAEALNGVAVGTLRVVTLWGADGPRGLYCVQKLPAKGAMIDGHTLSAHALAHVEPETGRLIRVQNMYEMNLRTTDTAPATGAPLAGVILPQVPQAVRLCETAHRLFPTHGLFGFDVHLAAEGPLIGEVNTTPFHMLYQRAADRPLLNPDFAPRLAEARTATEARIAARRQSATRGADGQR